MGRNHFLACGTGRLVWSAAFTNLLDAETGKLYESRRAVFQEYGSSQDQLSHFVVLGCRNLEPSCVVVRRNGARTYKNRLNDDESNEATWLGL
jgi:hypothetical protein